MLYEVGQKIKVCNTGFAFEISGRIPEGQRLTMSNDGDNYYQVMIEGKKAYISEKLIEILSRKPELIPMMHNVEEYSKKAHK